MLKRGGGIPKFVLFLALALAAYWNALRGDFVGDDLPQIVDGFGVFRQGLGATLVNVLPDRPFLVFTVWLNYLVDGRNPWGYKLTNVILHGMAGYFLYRLLAALGRRHVPKFREVFALVAGLVFVAHPGNSQTIHVVIQRGVILSGLFSFLSFLSFIGESRTRPWRQWVSLGFFALALLSKPNVATLPLIMALYLVLIEDRTLAETLQRVAPYLLLYAIPVFFYFGLHVHEQNTGLEWYEYLSVQARVSFIYLRIFLLPLRLRYIYDINPDPSVFANLTWLAILGHVTILGGGLRALGRNRLLGFSILAMYLAFLPETGLFPIRHLAFEHRAYLPYAFLLAASVFGLERFARGVRGKRAALAAVGLVCLALTGVTIARNSEINSLEKFLVNGGERAGRTDRKFHLSVLGNLHILAPEKGKLLAAKFHRDEPEVNEYRLYTLLYDDLTSASPGRSTAFRELIDGLTDVSKEPLLDYTRQDLDEYVLRRLSTLFSGYELRRNALKVLAPQISVMARDVASYQSFISGYAADLNFLKEHYEARLHEVGRERRPDPAEYREYLEVLRELERVFNVKSVPYR